MNKHAHSQNIEHNQLLIVHSNFSQTQTIIKGLKYCITLAISLCLGKFLNNSYDKSLTKIIIYSVLYFYLVHIYSSFLVIRKEGNVLFMVIWRRTYGKVQLGRERKPAASIRLSILFDQQEGFFYMQHSTDRIAHTMTFLEHWLE